MGNKTKGNDLLKIAALVAQHFENDQLLLLTDFLVIMTSELHCRNQASVAEFIAAVARISLDSNPYVRFLFLSFQLAKTFFVMSISDLTMSGLSVSS